MDDAALSHLIARGAAAHPGIGEPPALRDLLATCLADGVAGIDTRIADLYLAAACTAGDPAAIARLDETLPGTVAPMLVRLGVPHSDRDEIVQRIRVALLVPDEAGACGLARYTGRGELGAYLRSVAVRIALKRLAREEAPSDEVGLLAALPDGGDSPELAVLKERCREHVRRGFAGAIAALAPRERTLLRQHYVDGLTVEMIARLHRVHRATCHRWIEAARIKILRNVRRHLRATLGLAGTELETMVALVRSQLDLSLARQLASGSA
jgi:RNA polymerase sigma-70 factor, ECF subfamily